MRTSAGHNDMKEIQGDAEVSTVQAMIFDFEKRSIVSSTFLRNRPVYQAFTGSFLGCSIMKYPLLI